jgi:hypothetical protein
MKSKKFWCTAHTVLEMNTTPNTMVNLVLYFSDSLPWTTAVVSFWSRPHEKVGRTPVSAERYHRRISDHPRRFMKCHSSDGVEYAHLREPSGKGFPLKITRRVSKIR